MKPATTLSLAALFMAAPAFAVDFKKDIVPILKAECYKCHSEESGKEKGGFVFDNVTRFAKDIGPGKAVEPGKADDSDFIKCLISDVDDDEHMPPKKTLPAPQIALFKEWINAGAALDGGGAPAPATAATKPEAPASGLPPAPVMQSWTNVEGKVIQAAKVRLDGENVVLRMANGQEYNYPLSKLSPESQAQAKAQ